MGWSLNVGKLAGIRLRVHFTFLIFMGWIVLSGLLAGKSREVVLANTLFMLGLFACVVLHEFGHALTARHYGILTKDITLLPIGGVARLEKMPDDPRQEFWVALAGPAVNVFIALGLWIFLLLTQGGVNLGGINMASASFAERILLVNISLVVFNMLPAFPMDGGRVVRALLATRLPYPRATQIAAHLGQGMAVLFGIFGFFFNPLLMFIALFVWIGATQEAGMVTMKSALGGIPVSAAMMTSFETVSPSDSLEHVTRLILSGSQQDFPVLDNGEIVGVGTRDGLMKALAEQRQPTVSEIMRRDIAITDASAMLETALQALFGSTCHTLPVVQDGRLVGLLTSENFAEFLMIQSVRHDTKAIHPNPDAIPLPSR